jgi:hypothetical protein
VGDAPQVSQAFKDPRSNVLRKALTRRLFNPIP